MSERGGHVSGRAGILPDVPSILLGTRRTSTGTRITVDARVHSAECGMRLVKYPPYPRHADGASTPRVIRMNRFRKIQYI